MTVSQSIHKLVDYACTKLGLDKRDADYKLNGLVDMLGVDVYEENDEVCAADPDVNALLAEFTEACVSAGLFEQADAAYYCDKVMGYLSANPSTVDSTVRFVADTKHDNMAGMRWLYDYCVANTYVKKAVLDKNPRIESHGLIVTINLAKPEFRDPKKAASGNSVKGGYPKCVICQQNVGFAARSKCTLRTTDVDLNGNEYFWQFSPYGYFYQHGICVNKQHTPMHVDRQTLLNLVEFVRLFPDYFIGSNAALPRIGGSVLAHDHYQGGGEILPLHNAPLRTQMRLSGYDDLTIGTLEWPGTCIRVSGTDRNRIVDVADKIRVAWENYTDESLGIVCRDEEGQHSAVSPTVVKRGDVYEMNLILRNNITSAQYPDGVFHAHPEFHSVKKESIGLIEAQGLFILPGRLVKQLADVEACVANGKLTDDLADFTMVYDEVSALCGKNADAEQIHAAMQDELGSICYRILQNTAVFKQEEQTIAFLEGIGFEKR